MVPAMAGPRKREIRDQDVQGLKCLRKIRPLLSRLRTVGTERDTAGNRRLFMDQYCALILMSLFSPVIESLRDLQRACALDKVRKRLGVTRASLGSLSERTIEADRCYILDRGYISYRLWNAINVAGSSYVCRSSDRTLATVTQANELTDADRAASVVSDEIVDLGWKSKQRTSCETVRGNPEPDWASSGMTG